MATICFDGMQEIIKILINLLNQQKPERKWSKAKEKVVNLQNILNKVRRSLGSIVQISSFYKPQYINKR